MAGVRVIIIVPEEAARKLEHNRSMGDDHNSIYYSHPPSHSTLCTSDIC